MILQRSRLGLDGKPTLGILHSDDESGFFCKTLERSQNGEHPCIPAGVYMVIRTTHHPGTPTAYIVPGLTGVPGRTDIHIHIANKVSQLLGCIAPGERFSDDMLEIESSTVAFKRLMTFLQGKFPFVLRVLDPVEGT